MYCNKCGKEVPGGSAFCPSCGAPVSGGTESEVVIESEEALSSLAAPVKKKKRSKIPFLVLLLIVLLAGASVFVYRTFFSNQEKHIARQVESAPEDEAYEDLVVSDVKVEKKDNLGACLTFTLTNNTDLMLDFAYIDITADFGIIDEYGDKAETELDMSLACWEPYAGKNLNAIRFLAPGKNKVVMLPNQSDGVVASYTPENGDKQTFTLEDASNIEVETGKWGEVENGVVVFAPQECDLDIKLSPDGKLSGEITNNSEDRWRSVTVLMRAENKEGGPARTQLGAGRESTLSSFEYATLTAEYVKPGATADLELHLNADSPERAEAMYVIAYADV